MDKVIRKFSNELQLYDWLIDRNYDFKDEKDFSDWLTAFFESGNEIKVGDTLFDVEKCLRLLKEGA